MIDRYGPVNVFCQLRTSTIELECCLECDALFWGAGVGVGGLCGVESIYIRLVVLRVVEHHNLLRDVGLEGIVWVRERRESVGHDKIDVVGDVGRVGTGVISQNQSPPEGPEPAGNYITNDLPKI